MTSWFHKTKRWWETTPPSLIGCSPGKSKRGNDGNTWAVFSCRHLHMCGVTYVFQVSGSPWWWALGVQSSAPGSLRFWFSSAGRGRVAARGLLFTLAAQRELALAGLAVLWTTSCWFSISSNWRWFLCSIGSDSGTGLSSLSKLLLFDSRWLVMWFSNSVWSLSAAVLDQTWNMHK